MQPPIFFSKATCANPTNGGKPVVSMYSLAGAPGAGSFNSTLNGGTYSSSSSVPNGIIYHKDPVSGNSYLARFVATATQACSVLLLDRLWDNGGITITSNTSQSITSPTWPARDNTGTTNGAGVLLATEVSAATGAGTPTITIGYTNSAGTNSRTGTNIVSTTASSPIGTFYQIGLQAGDTGVQSVQSLTLSATWTSGTINLVAYRILAAVEIPSAWVPNALDALSSGFPQIFNGTCPFLAFAPNTSGATSIQGCYSETQG